MKHLRLLLTALFVVMIGGAAVCQESPSYEVATVRTSKSRSGNHDWDRALSRLSIKNYTLRTIIGMAYGMKSNSQIIGGPKWLDDKPFDIEAKADDAEMGKLQSLDRESREQEYRLMLQSLLAERFKLTTTREERILPVYALVVVKSGTKLEPSSAAEPIAKPVAKTDQQVPVVQNPVPQISVSKTSAPQAPASEAAASKDRPKLHQGWRISGSRGHVTATTMPMNAFADWLTHQPETGDRVVLNKTGLTEDYSFEFDWSPDRGQGVPDDANDPGLFTALKEELGLELKAAKSPVEVIVVQAISEPKLD